MYNLSQIFLMFPLLSIATLLAGFIRFESTSKLARRRLYAAGITTSTSGFGLLTVGNPKVEKSKGYGFLTAILHLVPADISGFNVCQFATPGCKFSCLNKAGRGGMDNVIGRTIQAARYRKTRAFFEHRLDFMDALALDIARLCRLAAAHNLRPAVRLNGTSDIPWEKIRCSNGKTLFELFPNVIMYDYTKSESRVIDFARGLMPANYHLTFSRSELTSNAQVAALLNMGVNVAVPYMGDVTRMKWFLDIESTPVEVVDGDAHDLRFLDPAGSIVAHPAGSDVTHPTGIIVALTAKGLAKRDTSGFTVRLH